MKGVLEDGEKGDQGRDHSDEDHAGFNEEGEGGAFPFLD